MGWIHSCAHRREESVKHGSDRGLRMPGSINMYAGIFLLWHQWYLEHHAYLSQKWQLCMSAAHCALGEGDLLVSALIGPIHNTPSVLRNVCRLCGRGVWQKQREVSSGQETWLVAILKVIVEKGKMYMILCGLCGFLNLSPTTTSQIRTQRCLLMTSLVLSVNARVKQKKQFT